MASHLLICPIRHHGPGSARRTLALLEQWRPDCLLIEGPPEATPHLHWLADKGMEPPVALLVYRPDQPKRAAYFPYAVYSPEYQAARFALAQDIPVRFVDLPMAYQLALHGQLPAPQETVLQKLAELTGYPTYEMWWDAHFEQKQDEAGTAEAIIELMALARQESDALIRQENQPGGLSPAQHNQWRESFMRQAIAQARAEGYRRIAFVVGAWHSPALLQDAAPPAAIPDFPNGRPPTVAVKCAWIPWTYSRLSMYAGYGAGVRAPGWYHHLWQQQTAGLTDQSIHWLTQVAQRLREMDLDASPAQVIEGVRLAEALAALRGRSRPGLTELNEATQAVFCQGDPAPLQLIQNKLIVGERMGSVPDGLPLTPFQRDLQAQQKRLKIRPQPELSTLNLDLRQQKHRERSHLLHRLRLLGIDWGQPVALRGQEGTYREVWQLLWQPSLAPAVVQASVWGNTVLDAAVAFAAEQVGNAPDLPTLTRLLEQIILADLPEVLETLMGQLNNLAALDGDVVHLMAALPALAQVLRYGNIRQTDHQAIHQVVHGLLTRIAIALPAACVGVADGAAGELFDHLLSTHSVVNTLQDDTRLREWQEALQKILHGRGVHGLLSGRACRLLFETGALDGTEMHRLFSLNLQAGSQPPAVAQKLHLITGRAPNNYPAEWLEGFLKGSGLLLLHDHTLWQLVDTWVRSLSEEGFTQLLPLLRRTFASFTAPERRQIAERVKQSSMEQPSSGPRPPRFDHQQAQKALSLLARFLGTGA